MKNQNVSVKLAKLLGTIAIGGTIAATQTACQSKSSETVATPPNKQVYTFRSSLKGTAAKEEAESMAVLAESLVRANTFVQANQLANRALNLDSTNVRAQFVEKVTAPQMELKGILKRVLPLVASRPEKYAEYKQFLKGIAEIKQTPDTLKFLLDGAQDMHTEGDLQDVVEKYISRLDSLRQWLRANREINHTINVVKELGEGIPPCVAKETRQDTWETTDCSANIQKLTVKMNLADFEALRQMVSGTQVYFAMGTAYSIDGLYKVADSMPKGSPEETYSFISKHGGIGRLRSKTLFTMLPSVATDLVVGYRLAQQRHAEFCPKGVPAKDSRPGMLFNEGICVETAPAIDRLMGTIAQMAAGTVTKTTFYTASGPIDAMIDTKKFLSNPPENIHQLGPMRFHDCGTIAQFGDSTFGGLFAGGELNTILAMDSVGSCANR